MNDSFFLDKDMIRQLNIFKAYSELQNRVDEKELKNNELFNEILKKGLILKKKHELAEKSKELLEKYPTGDEKLDEQLLKTIQIGIFIHQKENIINEEEKTDKIISLLMMILNTLLNLLNENSKISVMDLLRIEKEIQNILYYAEDDEIIPYVEENYSWKNNYLIHKNNIK